MSTAFLYDPYGIRTRVTAVKGRCLNRLTNGPFTCSPLRNYIRITFSLRDVNIFKKKVFQLSPGDVLLSQGDSP